MSRFSKQSFFYQQKKRSVTKRVKKHIDTQSVLGDRRESILVFRPGAGVEEELGDIRLQAKSPAVGGSNRQRRPSSAASKKSSVWFPPIDPTGPHLTTNKVQLQEELIEEEKEAHNSQPNYKFNEIKIASTSILSNLARRLGGVVNGIGEIELPESLVNSLILSFNHLVADTIVEKREWQTDGYLDYERARKKKLFLTNTPNQGDPLKQKVEASLSQFVKHQDKGRKRKRNMSNEKVSFERPHTAKSTASVVSMKSDVSEAESRVDYDKLPPELRTQGPEILRHRRESRAPKPKIPGPRTRLEKFNNMKMKAARERKQKTKRTMDSVVLRNKPFTEKESEDDLESVAKQAKAIQMINFSMSSKDCADYGWIVHPSKTADPEGFTLNQWATTKLQEAMRQREESYLTAKLRGEDGPLIIKYYSDPHYRPFKGVRQRTNSFPMPAILNKLPPSLAIITSHSHNEDAFFSPAEGQILCLLVLPDGSGFCNYYSGRRAVSLSRKGDGSRGLYVVIFDDSSSNNVLASFMPDGRVCCYHKNGGLHLLADPCGGMLMDEDGFLTRQWNWPQNGEKMSYSVSIQLNTHVLFQCSGKYQMTVRFSCHGQMHRFPVGLRPEFVEFEHKNEAFWMKRSTLISSRLQSNLQFESDKDTCSSRDERESSQQRHRLLNSLPQSREAGGERDSLGASLTGSLSKLDTEPSRRELEQYKTKIKSVVDDWMDYYRQAIGIAPPSRHSSLSQSFRQHSSQGSRVVTSTSHLHHSHHLSSTKLSATPYTSRPISPTALPPGCSLDKELLVLSRAASPLEQFVIRRPQSQDSKRPFKVGPARPKPRPDVSFRHGCPIALHTMMVGKLDEMPQCRCDRRKIPVIRDLEFDVFLTTHVPPGQLIIIFVTCTSNSSSRSDILSNPLLHSLHEKQNINRYAPCQQSSRDMFRILKYDLSASKEDISTTRPLLVNRHDIAIGMFLMYVGGRLVGVFTGFNGYGTTKKDFLNQVQRSFENGAKGHFLPNDFKFSQSSIKLHSNSLWAYPVSGVLDELVSHTPSTATSSLTDLKEMDASSIVSVGKTRGSYDHEKDGSNFALSEVNMGREY